MICKLSDNELVARLKKLLSKERRNLKSFLEHLIELDKRRSYEKTPYPTLFVYCTKELGMADGEAYKRIRVARAAIHFPIILEMIGDRAIHVSAVAILSPHLHPDNHLELLQRAREMSARAATRCHHDFARRFAFILA